MAVRGLAALAQAALGLAAVLVLVAFGRKAIAKTYVQV